MRSVLVACEFSGTVREAFAAKGWDAWSCDLLPTEKPGQHIQGDAVEAMRSRRWDLMIAHPPCTYLTNAGVRHLHPDVSSRLGNRTAIYGPERYVSMLEAGEFFRAFLNADVPQVAIENPIPHSYAKRQIGMYSQVVQPWMFGHGETKATCLWLKGLPPLMPSHMRDDLFAEQEPKERERRLHKLPPSPERAKLRSMTFPGLARAMAEQWSGGDD